MHLWSVHRILCNNWVNRLSCENVKGMKKSAKFTVVGAALLALLCFASLSFAATSAKSFTQVKLQHILMRYLQQHRDDEHISAIQASVQAPWQKQLIHSTVGTTTWNGNK